MRWLRGNGLEIGAGKNPTPLYGDAQALIGDCDAQLAFGGKTLDFHAAVDSEEFAKGGKAFDFTIASHVLEHVDSFLLAVENLVAVTKQGGIIYLVLPDTMFLHDSTWIPRFEFKHHVLEYKNPLKFAKLHDDKYLALFGEIGNLQSKYADFSPEYLQALKNKSIPQNLRFLHHKHNYSYDEWLELMLKTKNFLKNSFNIVDSCYGHERLDCHFVLKVK